MKRVDKVDFPAYSNGTGLQTILEKEEPPMSANIDLNERKMNKFRIMKYFVLIILTAVISSAATYFIIGSKKPEPAKPQTKTEPQDDFALAADKLLANKQITEIKTMKHIWELAPFIGKSVQLYGRAAIPGQKSSGLFLVNGKLDLKIPANLSQQRLEKQGVKFTKKEHYYPISPFMLISGRISFSYLDKSNPESAESETAEDVDGGHWQLADIQVVNIFKQRPTGEERPADISWSIPNESQKEQYNRLFNGLTRDADMMTFARYISVLERQKETEMKSGKMISVPSNSATNGYKAGEINFLADLIPFVGSTIELKGKVIKIGENKFLVIGSKGNILLPMHSIVSGLKENETVIVCGKLEYVYYTPANRRELDKNQFCPNEEGSLYFRNVLLVKKPSISEIHDNLIPCIKEVPDFITWRARKAFFTGYWQDANDIFFRDYIINMMKEEAEQKKNPHNPH